MERLINERSSGSWHEITKHENYVESYVLKSLLKHKHETF